MREAELRRVLLAQACEEADPDGAFVPFALRERAGREARAAAPREAGDAEERYLAARAERLLEGVVREHPGVAWVGRASPPGPSALLVVAVGFGLGALADALGSERRVNLLAFPLLGVLGWNAVVYAATALRALRAPPRAPAALEALAALGARARLHVARLAGGRESAFAGRVALRFLPLWWERAGSLEAARWRARLHLGAAAFALGVIASMYAAGVAFAYRATWESTFLDAAAVRRLLAWLLGPASWLLGAPVPGVAAVAALEAPGHGEAAPWIHRWALTALLFVGLPRVLLFLRDLRSGRRLAASLPVDVDSPYASRLLAEGRGGGFVVHLLPYSTELAPSASARLRELAHTLFGNRAVIRLLPPAAYGAEPPAPPSHGATLLVFNLAQSPEQEVHGSFLASLREAHGGTLLVALDEARYREVAAPERVEERHRAWRRVLDAEGLGAVRLAPETQPDALVAEAREAAHPAVAGRAAR